MPSFQREESISLDLWYRSAPRQPRVDAAKCIDNGSGCSGGKIAERAVSANATGPRLGFIYFRFRPLHAMR